MKRFLWFLVCTYLHQINKQQNSKTWWKKRQAAILLSVDFRPSENTFWEKQLWAYPVLLSSWYQSEIPANVCQRKFPSNEKINLLSRRHYWKVTKHISLSHGGGNWKVSWQWAGSTSPSVERNLPSQQTQSVFIPEQLFHLFGDDQQKEGKCYI